MKELSFNKSTDYIGSNMEIINHVIPNIAKPMCFISNMSFLNGEFPDKMKISKIIPMSKPGDRNLICIIIPISF